MEFNCSQCGILLTRHEIYSKRNKFNFPVEVLTGKIHDIHYRQQVKEKKEQEKKRIVPLPKFPRVKASVILCPEPECNFPCVETNPEQPLVEVFVKHMKKEHEIYPTDYCIEHLKGKIEYFRHNNKIHYQDPFIAVTHESLRKTSWVS